MRDSIALRVTLAVFGALVLTQLVGYLLFTGERLRLLPLMNTDRIEAIVQQAVGRVLAAAPERRAAAAAALGNRQIQGMLSSVFAPSGEIVDPPPLHGFRRKMLAESGGRFDMLLIEMPLPPAGFGPPRQAKLWLRLPDRNWLVLTVPGDLLRQPDLLRMALWWGLSLLGAVPLSLFVARRLTAPIRRFSGAAERLGLDISASPLLETGPAELRAAAAAINGMQDRIKRFVDDRTEMLAAISHDLRTPISRLRLRVENLAPGSGRRSMIDDLQHMDRMIAATLDFARDANSGEAPCRIDLVSLVETECETLADLGRDIAYRGPSHLAFTCRPLALGRAVRNILENATAYGGRTTVTVTDRTDRAEIEVADCGPGIPEAEQSRVFEPFYRLDPARSGEQPGTGLGLAIARNILRGHGGDITLRNRETGGLLVVLWLPRAAA
ncbi:ATP-binding protein [Dongia sedimenti]|uniref:histidine kinase n=1 Tax=Dongia sedimenti TaxID=3064282 RepID=A0ABU0YMZ3_9PROT|nr:ATP-binding protein [Rhodospirillaceae bacterium R-7]